MVLRLQDGDSTYQLVDWKTVGVAVMISVCENPLIPPAFSLVKGLDVCVILSVQRCLTCCLILKQLQLILEPHTDKMMMMTMIMKNIKRANIYIFPLCRHNHFNNVKHSFNS